MKQIMLFLWFCLGMGTIVLGQGETGTVYSYARLDGQQNASLYPSFKDELKIEYTARKVDEVLEFEVYDDKNKNYLAPLPPEPVEVGPNKIILDLAPLGLNVGSTYLLKVTNIEGDVEYLRFLHQ